MISAIDHVVLSVRDIDAAASRGAINSVYFNDPGGNLIEVSSYDRSLT